MAKIAFIGAGSLGFTRGLVRDMLTFPLLRDATISLMDIDPERGLGRVRTRSVEPMTRMDRLENMDMGYHERVREGYLEIASEEPFRFRVLDGTVDPAALSSKINSLVMREISRVLPHPGTRLTFDRKSLE